LLPAPEPDKVVAALLEEPEVPEPNDFRGYLEFLTERGHNFIRLWRWEQFKSQVAGGAFHFCMTPQPWPRTGPGTAKDGKPKFDLSRFDPTYFDRLRDYVIAAGNEAIYVSVMLFEGFGLHLSLAPDNVEGHPFHFANNVNEIDIASINDYQVLPLDPRVQRLQEAYIRKVIDTVQDLPNVLYEVANESSGGGSVDDPGFLEAIGLSEPPDWGDSTQWQYWVIDFVKHYEAQMGYAKHPVGMTMQYPVQDQSKVNDVLFDSPADWISPGFDDVESPMHNSRWSTDPPANDGAKVIISDTDHYSPMKADALWAWKSFLRGHNPILYDLGIVTGVDPPDPSSGSPSFASLEGARYAMGDTLRLTRQMDLTEMEPRGDLSSTGYVLANPGEEYLVLQPSETANPFTVTLEPSTYSVQWYSVGSRETEGAGEVTVEDHKSTSFTAPFAEAGPAVLYLSRVGR
ncbi:MAG TPA: DUF6298 domain-containing protein, partial [Actinomycetota bacterium]|nr:DUF6298 domain-containing protein [Actinomycetota bacterium]